MVSMMENRTYSRLQLWGTRYASKISMVFSLTLVQGSALDPGLPIAQHLSAGNPQLLWQLLLFKKWSATQFVDP
jgi:hypothetical protein